ncbi:hypothetical protein RDT67_20165 [Serratia fonticola]|uniref:Uncharacterized protein n=1 Tax=Serratia fonticola TaxID=47917 RepID=A0AAJ2D8X4_SERFO|nr:hypothetical protein [Serratia fonticola]MDQ9128737.1 hypothetical protein [Serratia fonticola]
MSYFGFNPAQQNRELASAAENPLGSNRRSDADFFDGAFTAPFKGLYAGVTQADQVAWAGVDAVASPIARAVNETFGINDTSETFIKEQRRLAEQQVRALTPDRGTTGTAGQVLFSLAEIGGQAVAGSLAGGLPGAAATVGTLQGFSDYEKSSADGVDYGTAVEKALVTGGTSALGAVLPMSLGLRAGGIVAEGAGAALSAGGRVGAIAAAGTRAAPDIFYAAGTSVALGMAQRGLSAETLRRGGYDDMARQYDILDGHALATDAVLGVAFGGLGRFINSRGENIPTRTVTSEEVSAALTTSSHLNYEVTVSPGVPVSVLSRNAHNNAMNKAMADVLAGHPVDVGALMDGAQFLQRTPRIDMASLSVREALGLVDEGITARTRETAELSELAAQVIPRGERQTLSREVNDLSYRATRAEAELQRLQEQPLTGSGRKLAEARKERQGELQRLTREIESLRSDITARQSRLADSSPGGRFHDARSALERRRQEMEQTEIQGLSLFSTPKPRSREQIQQDEIASAERLIRGTDETANVETDIRTAERAVADNPDLQVHVVNPDDTITTVRASDLLEQANRDVENAKHDASLFEVAVSCFLRG